MKKSIVNKTVICFVAGLVMILLGSFTAFAVEDNVIYGEDQLRTAQTDVVGVPQNPRWNGRIIQWDAVEGADEYAVECYYQYEGSGGGSVYYWETNCVDYSFVNADLPWRFRVKAYIGDRESEWSEWSDYFDADAMSPPMNPDWQGYWPRWEYANDYDSTKHKFVVTLYKNNKEIGVVEGEPPLDCNNLIIENGSGTYYFTVTMVSLDGMKTSDTSTSAEKEINVDEIPLLDPPTNLHWDGTTVRWDVVDGANQYDLEVYDNSEKVFTGKGRVSNSYDMGALFDEDDLGSGVYSFRVTAIYRKNGEVIASSTSDMSGKFIVLGEPENVLWDGAVARWDAVEGATYYQFYLYRPNQNHTLVFYIYDTSVDMMSDEYREYFDEAGNGEYTFEVVARTDSGEYEGQKGFMSKRSTAYTYATDSYMVSFDRNGGTGNMTNVHVTGDYTLPENGFTAPEGSKFAGWSTSADGYVIEGDTVNISSDTTFYAVWTPILKLAEPTNLRWNGKIAEWDAVENAEEYRIGCNLVFAEGRTLNLQQATSDTYFDLTEYLDRAAGPVGTFEVRATASGYYDSEIVESAYYYDEDIYFAGNVSAVGTDTNNIKVELLNGGNVIDTKTVKGNSGTYVFKKGEQTNYTIRFSKNMYCTRECQVATDSDIPDFEIYLYGDVSGDGVVNNADILQINRKIANLSSVFNQAESADYRFKVANITAVTGTDSLLNSADVFQISRKTANMSSVFDRME